MEDRIKKYEETATEARKVVLKMIHKASTSHVGSNFSCLDIMAVVFSKLNIDKDLKPDRDRFVLSKGWSAAALYYFLSEKGVIPKEDLEKFGTEPYLGLSEYTVRGVDSSTGAMGHGLPVAVGLALAAKRSDESWKTYVLMSDGELDCGTTWECALIAAQQNLDNLTVIVDYNGFQAMGLKKEVLGMDPLADKWRAFNWNTIEVNGHDYDEIEKALDATFDNGKPKMIIAKTLKGSGGNTACDIFENKLEWHYKNVDQATFDQAIKLLNQPAHGR